MIKNIKLLNLFIFFLNISYKILYHKYIMNKICQQILKIKAYYLHFNLVYKVQLLLNNNEIDLIHKRI